MDLMMKTWIHERGLFSPGHRHTNHQNAHANHNNGRADRDNDIEIDPLRQPGET